MQKVTIYTDGGSKGNPGPGGYGVVLLYGEHRRELSGGFRQTTNNRMELLAAIEGLGALKRACEVTLYSDSRYVVDGMTKGWARRWRANGWRRNRAGDQALNADLWGRLLEVAERHRVT
ncbi:MAG: ribonuclease HI, partial [Acidobacteriota bacterium]